MAWNQGHVGHTESSGGSSGIAGNCPVSHRRRIDVCGYHFHSCMRSDWSDCWERVIMCVAFTNIPMFLCNILFDGTLRNSQSSDL